MQTQRAEGCNCGCSVVGQILPAEPRHLLSGINHDIVHSMIYSSKILCLLELINVWA